MDLSNVMVSCPGCNGRGRCLIPNGPARNTDGCWRDVQCFSCEGKGYVSILRVELDDEGNSRGFKDGCEVE